MIDVIGSYYDVIITIIHEGGEDVCTHAGVL